MNIYLDINGVILDKDLKPANYINEFLTHIINKYSVYWLTTHCKGDSKITVSYINQFFDQSVIDLLKKIKPTNWSTAKTEAIDFATPFFWFDDVIFDFEKNDLIRHNALKSWVKVDLSNNPDQLKDIMVKDKLLINSR